MNASAEAVLLGDIGATNARFACLVDGALGPIKWIEVAHHPTFDEAVEHFLQSQPRDAPVVQALFAVAGPVEKGRCTFTNCVPDGAGHVVVPSEGGHATMPANSVREDAVLDFLRQRFGHVSAERVLSGPGIENLYQAIIALDSIAAPPRNAADITVAALKGACPTSRAALEMFCAMLGGFAANAALTCGARGGVYIAGGIAPRILDFLATSDFRRRFEEKGRLRAYLEAIPSQVIVHPAATFLGLTSLALKLASHS